MQVLRGTLVESQHLVEAIVSDSTGKAILQTSGVDELYYPRSCIKPLQALLMLESGAYDQFSLSEQHLALACASHSGETKHTTLVRDWLVKLDCSQDCLICGPHDPFDQESALQLKLVNQAPTSLHNNCSGKHSGLLSYSRKVGITDLRSYGKWDSKVQLALRQLLTELTGANHDQAKWAMDGCGIPSYAIRIRDIAKGLGVFLRDSGTFQKSSRMVVKSMLDHPDLTSGSRTFATRLMRLSKGKVLLKPGAEGTYSGLLIDQGFSFVLKVRDGAHRAAENTVLYFLQKYSGWTEAQIAELATQNENLVTNWAGTPTGKIIVRET